MKQGSLLIRLIDVVFILLFGFMSISQVTQKSIIELPKSTETPPSFPDPEQIVVIGITYTGVFLVENEKNSIKSVKALVSYLKNKKTNYMNNSMQIRVRIRAAYNAPIKYVMNVADICDNLNIPKGIDVEKSGR